MMAVLRDSSDQMESDHISLVLTKEKLMEDGEKEMFRVFIVGWMNIVHSIIDSMCFNESTIKPSDAKFLLFFSLKTLTR
jgi:hypothetical protein